MTDLVRSDAVLTREEWAGVCAVMRAYWPHVETDDVSIDAWYPSVCGVPEPILLEAVYAFAGEGEKWPPTGGQLAKAAKKLKSYRRWRGEQVMEAFARRQQQRTGGELGERIAERVEARQLEQGENAG